MQSILQTIFDFKNIKCCLSLPSLDPILDHVGVPGRIFCYQVTQENYHHGTRQDINIFTKTSPGYPKMPPRI